MLIGRCMEPVSANIYSIKTGRKVVDPGDFTMYFHDDLPWLAATLDRLTWDDVDEDEFTSIDGSPLELKSAGWYKRQDWEDGPPIGVQIQLQIQMACANSGWGRTVESSAASEIRHGDLDRNNDFLESAILVLDEFYQRLKNNDPPPVEARATLGQLRNCIPTTAARRWSLARARWLWRTYGASKDTSQGRQGPSRGI